MDPKLNDACRECISDDIVGTIGNTPMVRINNIGKSEGLDCEFVAKCEFFNPGGSVKDRIAKEMIEGAERKNILSPHSTIIEPTSGNTGIGLAMISATRGYKTIITMPEKMSDEKVNVLKAFGTHIHRTPTELPSSHKDSHISLAAKIKERIGDTCYCPDQYTNEDNPLAHYKHTAEEIWRQCGGKIDVCVMGAGTGGTVSGVSKRLKELNPKIKIFGVDPLGSILSLKKDKAIVKIPYEVEGIGYDFIPNVLSDEYIDEWYTCNDKESFLMARRIIRQEGILCGGSSGSAMSVAIKIAKERKLGKGKRIVVLFPDSVRNYMSKFLSDRWMIIHDFIDPPTYGNGFVDEDCSVLCGGTAVTILQSSTTCNDLLEIIKKDESAQFIPIIEDHKAIGVVDTREFCSRLFRDGKGILDQSVKRAMKKEFKVIDKNTKLSAAIGYICTDYPVFFEREQNCFCYLSSKDLLKL